MNLVLHRDDASAARDESAPAGAVAAVVAAVRRRARGAHGGPGDDTHIAARPAVRPAAPPAASHSRASGHPGIVHGTDLTHLLDTAPCT